MSSSARSAALTFAKIAAIFFRVAAEVTRLKLLPFLLLPSVSS
jgi:hypothetical protein